MIRDRTYREYESALGISLHALVNRHRQVTWVDMCCGEGNALASFAAATTAPLALIGVDAYALPRSGVRMVRADASTYVHDRPAQIITCVHGLMYLAQKAEALASWFDQLAPGGVLAVTVDDDSFRIAGTTCEEFYPGQHDRGVLRFTKTAGARLPMPRFVGTSLFDDLDTDAFVSRYDSRNI